MLYTFIKSYFPDTVYQYRTDWLDKQSLDIYIPSKKIGIEYQGQQHYIAIEYFDGEKKLLDTQKRDKRKSMLCKKNKVFLYYWKYDEPINQDSVDLFVKK